MKYSQTLIDDEYESSNIASQKNYEAFLVISILNTLDTVNNRSSAVQNFRGSLDFIKFRENFRVFASIIIP